MPRDLAIVMVCLIGFTLAVRSEAARDGHQQSGEPVTGLTLMTIPSPSLSSPSSEGRSASGAQQSIPLGLGPQILTVRSETARGRGAIDDGGGTETAVPTIIRLLDLSLSLSMEAGESTSLGGMDGWLQAVASMPQTDSRAAEGMSLEHSPQLAPQGRGDGGARPGAEIAAEAGELGSGSVPTPSGAARNVLALAAAIVRYFPPAARTQALRVALCESRGDPAAVNGPHLGVFQARSDYHGPVPESVDGQVRQAAGIQEREGWTPWACR